MLQSEYLSTCSQYARYRIPVNVTVSVDGNVCEVKQSLKLKQLVDQHKVDESHVVACVASNDPADHPAETRCGSFYSYKFLRGS